MSKIITIPDHYDYKEGVYDLDSLFTYTSANQPWASLPAEVELFAAVMGENDDRDWFWIFGYDGKFYNAQGGCDYTGWDCQSWGQTSVWPTLNEAINAAPEVDDNRPIRRWLNEMAMGKRQIGVVDDSS